MYFKRKAQIQTDLILMLVFLFILAIASVVGALVFNNINAEIQSDPDMQTIAKTASSNVNNNYAGMFDNAFMIFLILFWVMLLATSFFIDTHPIFFAITLILLIFIFIIGMVISNSYEDLMTDADFSSISSGFAKTNWVMNNFLTVIIVIGFTTGLALYAKSRL